MDDAFVDGCGLPHQMKRKAHGFIRVECQISINILPSHLGTKKEGKLVFTDSFRIREMNESDHDFILRLSSRFIEFPLMPWRNKEKMLEAQIHLSKESLAAKPPEAWIFVAEDSLQNRLGYIQLAVKTDFFTREKQGAILAIAVAKEHEGKGVAKLLMRHAENWARTKGLRQLVLNVFANNNRARQFYQMLGYQTETMKMVKDLT
jgi:ribosomal protein S18 acetylase RimI-like enzyme